MLYPRESETREVKELSGIWNFKADKNNEGYQNQWYAGGLTGAMAMPVPASYNDITQDSSLRDHIGDVWYERIFFVPSSWVDQRTVIRIGSATHSAVVWINGKEVVRHKGGYLPFEAEISELIEYGRENRITIAVNNILDWTTIPPGEVVTYRDELHPEGYTVQTYFHDFFNYSGIHRPVKLYTTPKVFISDIAVTTEIAGSDGLVGYEVFLEGGTGKVRVKLCDEEGVAVAEGEGAKGELTVSDAKLWEPGNAYLYNLMVELTAAEDNDLDETVDIYRLKVGIRSVEVRGNEFLVNGKAVYFTGFGKHEDSDIRGKGADDAVNVKDFHLLKWIGANSFRTSHYPYSEEILELADREGIMVIDESTAVGMNFFNTPSMGLVFAENHVWDESQQHLLQVMRELIKRDKNHPCVVMWSVANEAATWEEASLKYFEKVIEETRRLDPTRPVTIVESAQPEESHISQLVDVVCLNRYYSWYSDPGHLDLIEFQIEKELRAWHQRFKKPIIMTEYGADTIAGLHQDPPVMFSEEYQCRMLEHHHNVFDRLDFVIGEQVWNFADFATKQGAIRVGGNKKGVFTRQRQPKAAAHMLKKRWAKREQTY